MRTKVKLKGGISLIVLVITIIVMIILAAAIILSLSNSGIISKANKAKTDSDTANLKEYVNTLRAEWELMTAEEQTAAGSFVDYANSKLAEKGYKRELAADGETVMNENATAAVKAGIKVGDVVTGYTLDVATYTTDGSENTCDQNSNTETNPQPQTVTTNTDITWKYLGVNANGELEIMADLSTTTVAEANTKVTLSGKGGYLKGPEMLNTICEKLYSKDGVGTARSMNIDDVNNILGYTGPKGAYYDTNGNTVTTAEPLKIGDIENKLGTTLSKRITPDGKDIGSYYSDYYNIIKTSENITNSDDKTKSLVYNAKNTYWLASPCVYAFFDGSLARFGVRCVVSSTVYAYLMFFSRGNSIYDSYAVRPIVTLNSNVTLTKDTTAENTWKIN